MAQKNQKIVVECCFIFVLTSSLILGLNVEVADADPKYLDPKHKAILKTIESDDGDIIDCVDIYKQPAFDDSSVQTLQMEPSSYPKGVKMTNTHEFFQSWRKNGECPEGTIPIRRSNSTIRHKKLSFSPFSNMTKKIDFNQFEEAIIVRSPDGVYNGVSAVLTSWGPRTEQDETSTAQMWATSNPGPNADPGPDFSSIKAGWIVYPVRYGDHRARLFIYWTGDNYNNTGCYDLDCKGFVQTHRSYALGGALPAVSTYNGRQHAILLNIFKDDKTGNWWLQFQGVNLGYFLGTQIKSMQKNAFHVGWGGEISNMKTAGHHTTTQMGSGHFAEEGTGKAASFSRLITLNKYNDPEILTRYFTYVSNAACYNLKLSRDSFFYGGAGYSAKCM